MILLGIITQLEHTLLMMKSYYNILTKDLGDTIQMFRIKLFLPLFLIISCCVNAGTTIPSIELKSKKGSIFIDNKTFNEFPKITIDTSTPWTKKARFEGVKISSILQHYGLTGQKIRIDALNEYWVEIPYEDTMKYDLILADKMNGETLPTRTFGPYWMLYPIDDFPEELKKPLYNSRLIWQVRSIYVN